MKIQYVADDGIAFDTEMDCREYEQTTAVGSDPDFINAIVAALRPIIHETDEGYNAISFDDAADYAKVAVAIAKNFVSFEDALEQADTQQNVVRARALQKKAVKK